MNRIKTYSQKILKGILVVSFLYFSWLMLKITLEYVPFNKVVSFLMIKQTEVETRPEYIWIFYSHVYTSIFVLFSGFLAITRFPYFGKRFHQIIGKIYVALILGIAAPSGIYMGIFANGNIFAKLSFIILGILWSYSTYKAYRLARIKDFNQHKKWMWRSFAFTLSALTLRMWKVILVYFFHPNPLDVYQIIAWLGWVPNILIIEYLIKTKHI